MEHTPPATTANNHAMENFKSLLLKCATASTPTQSLTSPQKAFFQRRIQQLFPSFPIPNHPPYAWMIENAINQLNDESGSSEEAISDFIGRETTDLPIAHTTLLKFHLGKLCERRIIVKTHDGLYSIGQAKSNMGPSTPIPSLSASPTSSAISGYSHGYASCRKSSPSFSFEYESSSTSNNSSTEAFSLTGKRSITMEGKRSISTKSKGKNVKTRGRGRGKGKGLGWIFAENVDDQNLMVGEQEEQSNMAIRTESSSEENSTEPKNVVSKKRGRPQEFQKRGRGRPRKNTEPSQATKTGAAPPWVERDEEGRPLELHKRGRGRPRKNTELLQATKRGTAPPWLERDVCGIHVDSTENSIEGQIGECTGQMEPLVEDSLDELIDEVYVELMEARETPNRMRTDEMLGEWSFPDEEAQLQVQRNRDLVIVECGANPVIIVSDSGSDEKDTGNMMDCQKEPCAVQKYEESLRQRYYRRDEKEKKIEDTAEVMVEQNYQMIAQKNQPKPLYCAGLDEEFKHCIELETASNSEKCSSGEIEAPGEHKQEDVNGHKQVERTHVEQKHEELALEMQKQEVMALEVQKNEKKIHEKQQQEEVATELLKYEEIALEVRRNEEIVLEEYKQEEEVKQEKGALEGKNQGKVPGEELKQEETVLEKQTYKKEENHEKVAFEEQKHEERQTFEEQQMVVSKRTSAVIVEFGVNTYPGQNMIFTSDRTSGCETTMGNEHVNILGSKCDTKHNLMEPLSEISDPDLSTEVESAKKLSVMHFAQEPP